MQPGGNALAAWEALLEEAKGCTRCPLYKPATQMVFGEGPLDATIMFVGEQPGDQEDLAGRPFVGPAGRLASYASFINYGVPTEFVAGVLAGLAARLRLGRGPTLALALAVMWAYALFTGASAAVLRAAGAPLP